MQQYSVCLAVLIIDCEVFVHFHRLQDYASDLESIASKLPDAFKVRVHLTYWLKQEMAYTYSILL